MARPEPDHGGVTSPRPRPSATDSSHTGRPGRRGRDAAIPPGRQGPRGRPIRRQPVRVADRMPERLLARRRREHRERRYRRGLLTGGADAHVATSGGRDHQDRRRIEALLAEMPRERRGRRRGLHLPDLCDAEGETAARPRRPSLGSAPGRPDPGRGLIPARPLTRSLWGPQCAAARRCGPAHRCCWFRGPACDLLHGQ